MFHNTANHLLSFPLSFIITFNKINKLSVKLIYLGINNYFKFFWERDSEIDSLSFHRLYKGKIEICSKVRLENESDLELAYTPGVAEPCIEIARDPGLINSFTSRWNSVAIVSDGTAVLGLGDIGPKAALPVMEGKAILFKKFGGVDAFPLCIDRNDINGFITMVSALEPTFSGINLEDISAPACFEIESGLKNKMKIPIFHDDQHGTAVVVLAGLINAVKLTGREFPDLRAVIFGSGAAGIAIAELIHKHGVEDITLCDRVGPVYKGRKEGMNSYKKRVASFTNKDNIATIEDAMVDKNCFIGVSSAGLLTQDLIRRMQANPIIFAMANPVPEIFPDAAYEAGAAVVATGRSDFPNQVNNVLAFPGIFRGALDSQASEINEEMKIAAANALAGIAGSVGLSNQYIIPKALDMRVGPIVAGAVAEAASISGVAKNPMGWEEAQKKASEIIYKPKHPF